MPSKYYTRKELLEENTKLKQEIKELQEKMGDSSKEPISSKPKFKLGTVKEMMDDTL